MWKLRIEVYLNNFKIKDFKRHYNEVTRWQYKYLKIMKRLYIYIVLLPIELSEPSLHPSLNEKIDNFRFDNVIPDFGLKHFYI